MRISVRSAICLAAASMMVLAAAPSNAAPRAERELLGIRLWRNYRDVLKKFGPPTRIEIGEAIGQPGGGPGGGGYTGATGAGAALPGMPAGGLPGLPGFGGPAMMPGGIMPQMPGGIPGMPPTGTPGRVGAMGPMGPAMMPGAGATGRSPLQMGLSRRDLREEEEIPGIIPGGVVGPGGVSPMAVGPGRPGVPGGVMPGMLDVPGIGPGGMLGPAGMLGPLGGAARQPGAVGFTGTGGVQSAEMAAGEVTWVYEKGQHTFMFLFNKDGRVIQISSYGYKGGGVTSRGVRLGDPVGKVYAAYGWTDNVIRSGNNLTLDYGESSHVAFQLTDLGDGKGYRVVGIIVAVTERRPSTGTAARTTTPF
ncbi:MAG TPA: hypothetical protein VNJ09_09330 [Chthonomonadales bacterium]|nr:hypothetical protein [Chthonomonadales bacterium]